MDKIDKEQIVRVNRVYGGHEYPHSDLDYAVERANYEKNFYKRLAYLVRSMTSNHNFTDGNKRTAMTIVLTEFENEGMSCDKYALSRTLVELAKTGEGDINKIERKLRKCSRK